MRGATAGPQGPKGDQGISIHAPREGSDSDEVARKMTENVISIHAPREGSDRYGSTQADRDTIYFNPRSP